MANYQNNMRYSRMGNNRLNQRQSYSAFKDTSCCMAGQTKENSCDERKNVHGEACCTASEEEEKMTLAMAYIRWQKWRNIYENCKGFHRGTIFAELDKPFLGRGGCNR